MKKDKKDSKDSKSSKSSKSGYGYHYRPGDAGFLDEDFASDFEDMFGYIVTADHFSYPSYSNKSSKKSKKSSKSGSYNGPGMSYPIYGKGGKAGRKPKAEKLPYYDSEFEIGKGKGSKMRPPKLTRPPSPNVPIGPPGGPPGK